MAPLKHFCAALAATSLSAHAVVTATSTLSNSTQPVASGDLAESGTNNWPGLGINNGANAAPTVGDTGEPVSVTGVGTYTFTLGPSASGYDIHTINVFSAWIDFRSGQNFAVLFSTDGAVFTPIIDTGDRPADNVFQQVSIADDGGAPLGTGITHVQFSVADGSDVYREIDIIGVATVPEPSSSALFGLGGLLLFLRRRK